MSSNSINQASPLMISVSGVRGIVGESLTPEVVLRFSQAYGAFVNGGKVLLARDTRLSGTMLKGAAIAGLLSVGCDVVDLDICPTPSLQLSIPTLGASGAVCLTASHNPAEWNALKFFRPNGMYLGKEDGEAVIARYQHSDFELRRWDRQGVLSCDDDAVERHLAEIIKHVDVDLIRKRKLKVALDCVNGAGVLITPLLLEQLGCTVVPVNFEIHCPFAHNPEPIVENLNDLCAAVRVSGADIGLAHDADVDRVSIVTNEGIALGEEYSLAVAVNHMLQRQRGPVVTNLSTSRAIDDIAARYGCPVERTPIGDVNVSTRMEEIESVVGGEGNGGVIFPAIQHARDGIAAVALILEALAGFDGTMADYAAGLPQYYIVKRKTYFPKAYGGALLRSLRETVACDEIDDRDGLKFIWPDRWLHVRTSGTEPIVRVIGEAPDRAATEQMCDDMTRRVMEFAEHMAESVATDD